MLAGVDLGGVDLRGTQGISADTLAERLGILI